MRFDGRGGIFGTSMVSPVVDWVLEERAGRGGMVGVAIVNVLRWCVDEEIRSMVDADV